MIAARLLERYAAGGLRIMARRRGFAAAATAPKAALIAFLEPRLFSPEANRRLVHALGPGPRRLLQALKARGGRARLVALAAAVEGSARETATDLRDLLELGLLLYPADESGPLWTLGAGERVWMDRSTADALEPVPGMRAPPRLLARPPAWTRGDPPGLLQADLVLLLAGLERHEVRLLADGDPGLRGWAALGRGLLVPELVGAARAPEDTGRLWFLYLLLDELGLVKVRGGRLVPAESAAGFFHGETDRQLAATAGAWRRLTRWNELTRVEELMQRPAATGVLDLPSPGRVLRARARVLAALRRFDPGRWYAFSALRREIKASHPGFLVPRPPANGSAGHTYGDLGERGAGGTWHPLDRTADWDRVEGRFIARILLEPLGWLGAVESGFDAPPVAGGSGSRVDAFRVTATGAFLLGGTAALPAPEPEARLIVQPDFHMLLLSAAPDPGLLHDLSRCAQFTGGDRVTRFTLSRASVLGGFRAGWDGARLRARLLEASGRALPQNVDETLTGWERSFQRFRIETSVSLIEAPAAAAPTLRRLARGRAGALAPLGAGLWQVASSDRDAVLDGLRRAGVTVRRLNHATRTTRALESGPGLRIAVLATQLDWVSAALLARLATPQSPPGRVWRLDRRRVRAALRLGWTEEALRRGLESRAGTLSPEARLALHVWSIPRGQVRLERTALFSCADPDLAQRVLATPSLVAHLEREVAPGVWVIRSGEVEALRRGLRLVGLAPGRGPSVVRGAGAPILTARECLPRR